MVRRSSERISSAVSSSTMDLARRVAARESALAVPAARLAVQVAHQPRAVRGVARDAVEQLGVGRDERQIEQLRIGLLLQVDAFLLVPLVLGRALDVVE